MSFDEQTTATHVRSSDLANADADQGSPSIFVLHVLEGPDAGRSFRVDGSEASRTLLGQSDTCVVRLADREISRRHAALELTRTGLRLTDLGSTNGTYVDRVRIADAFLVGGEVVRVGGTVLRVVCEDASPTAPPEGQGFGRVVGASLAMRRLYPLCEKLAQSDVPVVIEGETGTGKEVLAEAIHASSRRAAGPFVVFDCTAVPPSLVESELFGHERGAFTGAVSARAGVFEQAAGGTLLIDEIGDFDLTLQPKLLRALERGEVRRVGGQRWLRLDVRVMAATRRDLDREVQEGRFRDDLFHRIAVTRVELPPLRDRHGDVRVLAEHFSRDLGDGGVALSEALLAAWDAHAWPGNVRELRNAVARQLALGDLASAQPVTRSAVGADVVEEILARGLPFIDARDALVERFEQRYVERMLARCGGDLAKAAAASGIGRRYFQKLRAKGK